MKRKNANAIEELKETYASVSAVIEKRLSEFQCTWQRGDQEELFVELVFCLLTPQSKAKSCWQAVENLRKKDLLLKGNTQQIMRELKGVRFKYKKAQYLVEARKVFFINGRIRTKEIIGKFSTPYQAREWLVQNVKGPGYKEASHFLRNIGLGDELAILDRHILKNLSLLGVIKEIPSSLSKGRYLELEKKMMRFASRIKIPLSHLDLLLWYKETGEVFK
ncbi:N-glycosylase/DNA lyase [Candidatus Sumerlaeota bacterium]|nr:N-glycosylase/DNA lyase [Candidatus Sumerlaeota bacterium]